MIQAKELCSVPVSPLVVSHFSTQWSQDNQLSVLTEKGVHVFELIPAPTCGAPIFKFSRSFIYPSEILPARSFEEEIDSVLWKLERIELYLFLMEEAITPSVDGAKDLEPRLISLAWSPSRLVSPCKCLLATVTSAGAVDILFKVSRNWFSACNLTAVWIDEIYGNSEANFRSELRKAPPDILRNNLRRLQATAIAWSDLHKSGKEYFAYLITAYRNAEIVVWRVPGISHASQELKPSIVFKRIMEPETKINVLKWISLDKKILIIVGYLDGRVNGLSLDIVDRKFENCTVNKYWVDTDHIPVSCIEFWNSADYGRLIVVCKGSFLCTFQPSDNGIVKDMRYIHVGGFSITGVVEVSDRQLMITTQNSNLLAVYFENERLIYKDIKHNLPSSHVQYLGLSSSLNKSLFFNMTSPDVMHDHLINREPSVLCIFMMEGNEWNSFELLKKNETKLLTKYWDCLESIRVQVLKSQDSCDELLLVPENLDKLSDYELHLAMWTSVIADTYEKRKFSQRNMSIIAEISDAYPLIFVRLATARLIELGSKKNLSKEQHLCASLLRSYLEVYLAGEEEESDEAFSVKNAKKALNSTSHLSSVEPESCDICGEIITELSWKNTSCSLGHKLPRCAVTLLQVSTTNYRSCPICGEILHPCLDEEYEEPLCPYCEVPALYDSRVFKAKRKSALPVRNLSKRRVGILQKSHGIDKSDENSRENPESEVLPSMHLSGQ